MRAFAEGTYRDFSSLLNGPHLGRLAAGDRLVEQLLPRKEREELAQRGLVCEGWQETHKAYPFLKFTFVKTGGVAGRFVTCDVGARLLHTENGDEPLRSLRQVRRKILQAIHALSRRVPVA